MSRMQPDLIATFYNANTNRMRIMLRSPEQLPSEAKQALIDRLRERVDTFFADSTISQKEAPKATGMFVMLAQLIESLLSDQRRSFLVACLGILMCTTVAFRSVRIGLISLLPNIFPLAMVMGVLGWSGVKVNIGTAMITSVSMGLTVDSTIHYITAFERHRRKSTVSAALEIAHASAGRAVVFAHFALAAGFLVLMGSRFVPLVYFGGLLSLSMIGGIFGDLVLLPLCLRWTSRDGVPAEAISAIDPVESD